MQNSVYQNYQTIPQQVQPQVAPYQCGNCQAQPQVAPQQNVNYQTQAIQQPIVNYQTQPQSVQVPNYSGVNIQIFNPSVATPGGSPVYNVNAPQYQTPSCYPAGYYTGQYGPANNQNGQYNGLNQNSSDINTNTNTNTTNTTIVEEKTKKEKRNIVELTDSYIRNLENYLNSQDKEIRLMGAKEVVARIEEDESRKDDKALTALTNKMLQDPCTEIRIMALAMLNSRKITGDDYTTKVLQTMQQSDSGYGQDSLAASEILLKMSGQTVQKEFDVKEKPENKKENK